MSVFSRVIPFIASTFDTTSRTSKGSACSRKSTQVQIIDRKIQSLEGIAQIRKTCSSLYLQQNEICNFIGLPELPMLTRLDLDGNSINSFEGCRHLPNLRFLSVRNNPISRNKYVKLMGLVAFGEQLLKINNEPVPADAREDAAILKQALFPLLYKGKILTNLKPLRVADTRQQSYCAPDQNLIEASRSVGYTTPLVDRKNQAWSQRLLPESPPSTMAAWHYIVINKMVQDLPREFQSHVYGQFLNLRDEMDQPVLERTERTETEQDGRSKIAMENVVEVHEIFTSDSSEVRALVEEQIEQVDEQECSDDEEEEEEEALSMEKGPTENLANDGEPTEEQELSDNYEEEDALPATESGTAGDSMSPSEGYLSE
jgi:hypothetical protein